MQNPGLPSSLGCSPQTTLGPEELSAGSPLASGGQQRAVENELEGAGHQDRGFCGVRGLGGSGHWVCPVSGPYPQGWPGIDSREMGIVSRRLVERMHL